MELELDVNNPVDYERLKKLKEDIVSLCQSSGYPYTLCELTASEEIQEPPRVNVSLRLIQAKI